MKLGNLSSAQLSSLIGDAGVTLRTGPIVVRLRTRIPYIAEGIQTLYRDFDILESSVPHFDVELSPPRSFRRFIHPQVNFHTDGRVIFLPLPYHFGMPLLEWGLNWCVHNEVMSHLILHSAVLEQDGKALLLSGASGAGKSTLAASLALGSFRLLSDELALVRLTDGSIQPNPRPVGLKDQSIALIRERSAGKLPFGPEATDENRGTICHMGPPTESVARMDDFASPAVLIFPKFTPGAPARLSKVSRARAFLLLAQESFNYGRLGRAGFDALERLMSSLDCYQAEYADLDSAEALVRSVFPG